MANLVSINQLRPSKPLDALLLASLIWFLAKFLRYAFPPLFESLGVTYGVSNAVLGASFTGLMLAYAAMQFPSGALADRFGSVPVIAGGVLLASVAALVLIVDSSFMILVVAMVVIGAGTGAHKTVAIRLVSMIYPESKGRAIGVLDTIGTFGGVAAPIAVIYFIGQHWIFGAGWRLLFLIAGASGICLALLFVQRVPTRIPDESAEGQTDVAFHQYLALFRRPKFTIFVIMVTLFAFAYSGITAFLPLYIVNETGLTTSTASLLYSVLFLASLSQVIIGDISDRVGQLPILFGTLGLASVSLVALVLLSGNVGVTILGVTIVGLGIGAHGSVPVRGAYLMAVLPPDIAGGSLGVVRTFLMGAAAISPAVAGILSDIAGFEITFWLLAALMSTASILAALLWVISR